MPYEITEIVAVPTASFCLSDNLAVVGKGFVQQAFLASSGNRTEAARLLGISRKNLWEKMRQFHLE